MIFIPFIHSHAEVVVRLYPKTTASGHFVELSEIAKLSSGEGEKASLSQLKKIVLFPLPKHKKTYSVIEISRLLRKKTEADLIFIGQSTKVKPLYTRILVSEIIEKLKTATLKKYTFLSRKSLKILLLTPLKSVRVPFGDICFRIILPGGKFSMRKFGRLEILLDDKLFMSKTIEVRLMAYVKVIVAKRNLKRNERLSLKNVWVKERPVCKMPSLYLLCDDKLENFRLRHKVRLGKKILKNSLKK